jgi:hypothetical protein
MGTLAHAMGEHALRGEPLPDELSEQLDGYTDEEVDDMYAGVQLYVDYVRGVPGQLILEEQIESSALPGDFGGTIDALRVTNDTIHVVDFKYGLHFVPAVGNTQMKSYLCLARQQHPGRTKFFATIVQPRVMDGRCETVEFTGEELDAHMIAVIDASMSDSIVAGSHCRWCPLLQTCEVAYEKSVDLANCDFEEVQEDEIPDVYRLIEIVEFAPVVSELAELARTKMLEVMKQGVSVPGYKAAQSLGHRTWKDEGAAVQLLTERYPERSEQLIKIGLKSPAQIEKIIPKTVLEEMGLYMRPLRGITVVPAGSKLQEVSFGDFDVLE